MDEKQVAIVARYLKTAWRGAAAVVLRSKVFALRNSEERPDVIVSFSTKKQLGWHQNYSSFF